MSDPNRVAVIATVFNEVDTVQRLVEGLAAQSRPPDEVVIVDGGSTDGTWEILTACAGQAALPFHVAVIRSPGANISTGRNLAIRATRAEVIAATDAGVVLPADWLAHLVAPFAAVQSASSGPQIVAGFFEAEPRSPFETALGATTLPTVDDIQPAAFLPSSRSVAFTRRAFELASGYPEWLDYSEDLVFDLRLRHVAGPAVFVPQAAVRFRPRSTLAAFCQQYYRYARGDGKANLWALRHALRYGTYLVALPLILALAFSVHPAWLAAGAAGLAAMVRRPFQRLLRQGTGLTTAELGRAMLWVPVLKIAGDMAKMAGYPVGLAWRLRNQPPEWRPSRWVAYW